VVPSVKAACDVGMVDEGYQLIVRAALEVPVAFAQVHVDFDGMLDRWHGGDCVLWKEHTRSFLLSGRAA
jgi:hypothetical protein